MNTCCEKLNITPLTVQESADIINDKSRPKCCRDSVLESLQAQARCDYYNWITEG